jgi:hypothetical protein
LQRKGQNHEFHWPDYFNPFKPENVWDEHGYFPVKDWKYAVDNNDTRQGYIDWVNAQIEQYHMENKNGK